MSFYLSIRAEKEIIERIKFVDKLRESLIDLNAEYDVIVKRNPLVRGKGSGDYSLISGNADKCDPRIAESMRVDYLRKKITEYSAIVNDYDVSWRLLTDREKQVLTYRYINNMKQEKMTKEIGYSVKQISRIEEEAMRKLKLHMNIY